MPTNLTGQMLGKVRVDMFLARGGMADVFIGTHTTLNRAVAIKFLKGDLQDEPDLRERFEREAQAIAMLRHPNIVQVYDFDSYENQPYLIMEYVAGASLNAYLRELHNKQDRLGPMLITRLVNKLASALQYAHNNHVIHRDIKPANILLTSPTTPVEAGKPLPDDVEPIITDFGLVRFTQSNKQTSTGVITGTPAYMSPEQALGAHVDQRTDVYSLAVTVYEMLAGRIPFESDSTLSLLHKQIYDPPPPIAGISEELQAVMKRALAKNAAERFDTTTQFADEFQKALAGTSPATIQPLTLNNNATIPSTTTRPTYKTWVAAGLTGLLVLMAGFSYFSKPKELIPALSPTPEVQATETMTPPPPTEAMAAPQMPQTAIGLLRFQDGATLADQTTLTTFNMPLPPESSQYEAWLLTDDGEQRLSLGYIQFDEASQGSLNYVDSQGRNLIGKYHALEISIEPNPDDNPIPSGSVAFASFLPPNGFDHVRHILFAFSGNPNQTGFMDGLDTYTKLLESTSQNMLAAFDSNDEAGVREQAEIMLNAVVGNQSADYKDWNSDGNVDDLTDGFGLLLNGDNEGYIQGALSHAGLSASAPDANDNMRAHGEHVVISMTNVSNWTPQLRDTLIEILSAPPGSDLEAQIRRAAATANQIRNGVDVNGNELIEPIAGEGGAVTAYQHAYYMADITIFIDSNTITIPTADPNASPIPYPPGYN